MKNDAAIYFDFNEPIITNEVSVGLKTITVGTQEIRQRPDRSLKIYPNPAQNTFYIEAQQRWNNGVLSLYNIKGQLLQEQKITNLDRPIHFQTITLPNGIYFVKLISEQGVLNGKVIIQRN